MYKVPGFLATHKTEDVETSARELITHQSAQIPTPAQSFLNLLYILFNKLI
jgi:hypothetical protein